MLRCNVLHLHTKEKSNYKLKLLYGLVVMGGGKMHSPVVSKEGMFYSLYSSFNYYNRAIN